MFEVEEDKKKSGAYFKKLILSKYKSQRKFCEAFLERRDGKTDKPTVDKFTTKISEITRGVTYMQTADLPYYCELLGVSCEELLSAGKYFKPISGHVTNYEVAFSKDPELWDSYMSRKDKLFLNYDEYGKSVVDYALEFKNYKFIKYLMGKGHLKFKESDDSKRGFSFGLSTDIKRRKSWEADIWPLVLERSSEVPYYYEEFLRNQTIKLAVEKKDYDVLEKLRARETPALHGLTIASYQGSVLCHPKHEELIDTVAESDDEEMIKYFSTEFEIEDMHKRVHPFMFPFLGDVIDRMVKNKHLQTANVLKRAIAHNKKAYETLEKCTKELRDSFKESYLESVMKDYIMNGLNYLEDETIVSYHYSLERSKYKGMVTNIVKVKSKSSSEELNQLINELNGWADKIINYGK